MDMRLGTFQMPALPGAATATATAAAGAQAAAAAPAASAPPDGFDPSMMPPDGFPGQPGQQTQVTLDGPQPVLDEIQGYEISPEFFTAWNMSAARGSLFTTGDMKANAAYLVVGAKLAATLFEDGISLDRQVLSRNKLYTITGILAPTGTDYDSMAFTPALMVDQQQGGAAFARMFMRFDTSLHFTVADATRLEQARAQLESWFTQTYGASSVVLTVPRSAAEAARDRNGRLVTVILFLALSALVIAAANVTNILSSRAMRKRRSVGILKALGATPGGVFRLFVIEALIIGAAGAVLGTGFSILISWLMQTTMGFGGVMIGLLAGGILGAAVLVTALDILPAMQAARVPAAEAIRYE
jgi:putative ABC transport system permease protein